MDAITGDRGSAGKKPSSKKQAMSTPVGGTDDPSKPYFAFMMVKATTAAAIQLPPPPPSAAAPATLTTTSTDAALKAKRRRSPSGGGGGGAESGEALPSVITFSNAPLAHIRALNESAVAAQCGSTTAGPLVPLPAAEPLADAPLRPLLIIGPFTRPEAVGCVKKWTVKSRGVLPRCSFGTVLARNSGASAYWDPSVLVESVMPALVAKSEPQ